jgi:hypothetical protein
VSLWLSITLASSAVLAAAGATAYELALRERSITRSWRRTSTRARTTALIAFLVLIIIAQFLLFLSATT